MTVGTFSARRSRAATHVQARDGPGARLHSVAVGLLAAAAMALSSLSVVANSATLKRLHVSRGEQEMS